MSSDSGEFDIDNEDEFEFENYANNDASGAQAVNNQHYDVAVDVSDESTDQSVNLDDSRQTNQDSDEEPQLHNGGPHNGGSHNGGPQPGGADDSDPSSDESDEQGGAIDHQGGGEDVKLYNPQDYSSLNVTAEIRGLFDYIDRYKPQDIELDSKLKPFIPDYIPAVGEIDSFLKVPQPDDQKSGLGLTVLDEPCAQQSHPSVLLLRLRMLSKRKISKAETVGTIENATHNPKQITNWIKEIEELHRIKPPPNVHYGKTMPNIEQLMQVWPAEFEDLLKNTQLPTADLDLEVADFTKIVCAILDIPVYDKVTESLHVLFTLYSEFKKNPHFQHG